MNVQEAIQRAKTCAPTQCQPEPVCFFLACEVERLLAILNPVEEVTTQPPAPIAATEPEPTFETPAAFWSEYNATI